MNNPDNPRTLRNPAFRDHRIQLLLESHMKPLVRYTEALRATDRGRVPDFDPLDGGVRAQALFLLEKPGPMTDSIRVGRSGSGFISRDNDDPTAEAIHRFMNKAGIPRDLTLRCGMLCHGGTDRGASQQRNIAMACARFWT